MLISIKVLMKELGLRLDNQSWSSRVTGLGGGNGVSALGYNGKAQSKWV